MALKIWMEPNRASAEAHAQKLVAEIIGRHAKAPILPARESAMVPTYCNNCGEKMWQAISGDFAICDTCRAAQEKERKRAERELNMVGQLLAAASHTNNAEMH